MAEIQVSESSIDEREVNLIDETQNLVTKEQDIGNQSSDSLIMNSSTTQKFSSNESASLNVETSLHSLIYIKMMLCNNRRSF